MEAGKMMKTLSAAFALTLLAPSALAGPEAEAVVQTASIELVSGNFVGDKITRTIDVKKIARFTLGKHVRRADKQELAQFEEDFSAFIVRAFERNANAFVGAQVEVLGSKDRNPKDTIVQTRLTLPGEEPEIISWRLLDDDGEWRVVDMQARGLWLAIEQRAQMSAVLDRTNGDLNAALRALDEGGNG